MDKQIRVYIKNVGEGIKRKRFIPHTPKQSYKSKFINAANELGMTVVELHRQLLWEKLQRDCSNGFSTPKI